MPLPQNSTVLRLYIDGTAVGYATDTDFTLNKDLPEYTNKDSGAWVEKMSGVKSASGSVNMFYVEGSLDALYAWIDGTAVAVVKISSEVSTEEYFSCDAHGSSLAISSPSHNQPCTASFNWESTGAITKGDNM